MPQGRHTSRKLHAEQWFWTMPRAGLLRGEGRALVGRLMVKSVWMMWAACMATSLVACCGDLVEDVGDAVELAGLVEEIARAGRGAGLAVLRLGVVGEDDEGDLGSLRVDRLQDVQAGA